MIRGPRLCDGHSSAFTLGYSSTFGSRHVYIAEPVTSRVCVHDGSSRSEEGKREGDVDNNRDAHSWSENNTSEVGRDVGPADKELQAWEMRIGIMSLFNEHGHKRRALA